MVACSRPKLHLRGCVALIVLAVDVEAEVRYADQFEEVDIQRVWLRAVGLPELGWGWVSEGGGAAGGFMCRDGPGREGGDFFEMRWDWPWWRV